MIICIIALAGIKLQCLVSEATHVNNWPSVVTQYYATPRPGREPVYH